MVDNNSMVTIYLTAVQIKAGGFLLGKYDRDHNLIEVTLNTTRDLPAAGNNVSYRLIEDGALDGFMVKHCKGWNTPIEGKIPTTVKILFNRANGQFLRWEPVQTASAA
jgi:hypothetical protein